MDKLKTGIKDGTKDFIFGECKLQREICDAYLNLFEKWGYDEIKTPTIEFLNVFSGEKIDEMIRTDEIYMFTDEKNRLIALRPDCTMPIARVAATKLGNIQAPYRLCYSQKVFNATGQSHESAQCGVELIGPDTLFSDIEILNLAIKSQKIFFDKNFRIEIGHGKLFKILIEEFNIEEELAEKARKLIEHKNFAAIQEMKLPDEIKILPRMFGDVSVLDEYAKIVNKKSVCDILDYLKRIYDILVMNGYEEYVYFDLGIVHRLDYYTGIIFRSFVEGSGQTIISGGRYNNLLENYGNPFPAVGFGIAVDPVFERLKRDRIKKYAPDSLIYYEPECCAAAYELANSLTEENKSIIFSSGLSEKDARTEAERRNIKAIYYLTKQGRRVEAL